MRRSAARQARRLAVALSALAAGCADDGPDGAPPAGFASLRVVEVAAVPCDRPLASRGMGVVVADGVVATAAHTVDGARREITVDGAPAEVVALDARTDLALLAAPVTGAATLARDPTGSVTLHLPDHAVAVTVLDTGPLVVHDTTARARHRREVHTIQPGVADGTSGAPLVDQHGRVVGIVVLDHPADGTAFAVTGAELAALRATDRVGSHAAPRCHE